MSKTNKNHILVAKVVDAIYGNMFSNPPSIPDTIPVAVRNKILKSNEFAKQQHHQFARELYESHMTTPQLEMLLNFHTSDLGKSIQKAQAQIHKDLDNKLKTLETVTNAPSNASIGSISYLIDYNDSES